MQKGCVFCQIVKGEKKVHIIYEDKGVLVFLDEFPIAKGHTLVVFKRHCRDIMETAPEEAAKLGKIVAWIAHGIKLALGAEFIYIASLCEDVRHVHFHLIPRYKKDKKGFGHFMSPRGRIENGGELATRIESNLPIYSEPITDLNEITEALLEEGGISEEEAEKIEKIIKKK